MYTINVWLLLGLLICHWAADFTQLSTPWMLNAKRRGAPLFPIFCHAGTHLILMMTVICGLCYVVPTPHWDKYDTAFMIILLSHFIIDVWKGRMNVWFPSLTNPTNVYHWWIFGLDQLLHILVIIFVTIYIS